MRLRPPTLAIVSSSSCRPWPHAYSCSAAMRENSAYSRALSRWFSSRLCPRCARKAFSYSGYTWIGAPIWCTAPRSGKEVRGIIGGGDGGGGGGMGWVEEGEGRRETQLSPKSRPVGEKTPSTACAGTDHPGGGSFFAAAQAETVWTETS